jgi:hypothetical protein
MRGRVNKTFFPTPRRKGAKVLETKKAQAAARAVEFCF